MHTEWHKSYVYKYTAYICLHNYAIMHYQYREMLRPILNGEGVGKITLEANFEFYEVIFQVTGTSL